MKRIVSVIVMLALLTLSVSAATPQLSLSRVKARAGANASVILSINDNVDLSGLKVSVTYSDTLTLLSVTRNEGIDGFEAVGKPKPNGNGTVTTSYAWVSGTEAYGGPLDIAEFVFALPENAENGKTYMLTLTADEQSVIDLNENPIRFRCADGAITVKSVLPGDVNSDQSVTMKDAAVLAKYLAGWQTEIDLSAADVTSDGVVNAKDVTLLMKYLTGWNVVLG